MLPQSTNRAALNAADRFRSDASNPSLSCLAGTEGRGVDHIPHLLQAASPHGPAAVTVAASAKAAKASSGCEPPHAVGG